MSVATASVTIMGGYSDLFNEMSDLGIQTFLFYGQGQGWGKDLKCRDTKVKGRWEVGAAGPRDQSLPRIATVPSCPHHHHHTHPVTSSNDTVKGSRNGSGR